MSFEEYLKWVNSVYGTEYGGQPALNQTYTPNKSKEEVPADMAAWAARSMGSNAPLFSLLAFRLTLFSQVRWQWQQLRQGRPGDLFSTPDMDLLNGDPNFNARLIQDADLAGNAYTVLQRGEKLRLIPSLVSIVLDLPANDPRARPVAYMYHRDGLDKPALPEDMFFADEVAHWAPIPDPLASFRGMSWLQPAVREVQGDDAMTSHKSAFMRNAATPNMVVKMHESVSYENFLKFKEEMEEKHAGVTNAYKTLYLGGGADATVVGSNLKDLEYSITQGKGETRLASLASIPPVLVGFSEGLSSATYSNYGLARRRVADGTFHPLWVSAAGALGRLFRPPNASRLWYDARDIPFLREDAKDDAEIRSTEAQSIKALTDAGYDPDAVIDAVTSGDLRRLAGNHTGLFSVQLQPPGDGSKPEEPAAPPNRSLRIVRDADGFAESIEERTDGVD